MWIPQDEIIHNIFYNKWCTVDCNANGISTRYYLLIIYYLLHIVSLPGCVLGDVDHGEQGGEGELSDHRHLHQSELGISQQYQPITAQYCADECVGNPRLLSPVSCVQMTEMSQISSMAKGHFLLMESEVQHENI